VIAYFSVKERMKSSASTKFRSKNARPGSDHESNSVAKDEEIIQDILQRRSRERKKITLFRKPFQTLSIFLFLLVLWFKKTTVQLVKRKQILLLILSLLLGSILLSVIPGPHQDFVERLIETMKIVIWWVTLGILSSIGLGIALFLSFHGRAYHKIETDNIICCDVFYW